MLMRRFLTVTSLVLLLAACGDKKTNGGTPTLSEAFCNDLRAGLTPMQIYGGVKDQYTPKEFADHAYGMAAISCKEQLQSNQGLRTFLTNWNINPDA